MPFARGAPKPAGSGRKKGTPNKLTREVSERLAELGCNPIEGMARIAMNKKLPPELRGRMFAELAQYLHPKRKAVELSGDLGVNVAEVLSRRFARYKGLPESSEEVEQAT